MSEQEIESFLDRLSSVADEHSGTTELRARLSDIVDPVLLQLTHQQTVIGVLRNAEAVRATATQAAAADGAEPIYQTCFIQGQWRDVDRAEYDRAKGLRADLARIVYTHPHATESDRRDAEEPAPSFKSPLTPYGLLVRALRIVAGTTLDDMGKHLGCKPSTLSSVEFGRQHVTDAMLADTASFFSSKGVPDTLHALRAALSQMQEPGGE